MNALFANTRNEKNGYIRISQRQLVDFINYGGALKTGNCVAPCGGSELFFLIQYHGLTPVANNVSPAARAPYMKALWNRDKQPPQGAKLLTSHGRQPVE